MDLPTLETNIRTLEASLDTLEFWITISTLLVVVGLVVEYWFPLSELIEAVKKRPPFPWKKLAEMSGGVLVTVGVAGELWFQSRASNKQSLIRSESHQIEALLNKEASDANALAKRYEAEIATSDARAKHAESQVAVANAQSKQAVAQVAKSRTAIAEAQQQAAEANRAAAEARLELAKLTTPRTLSSEQQTQLAEMLKPFSGRGFLLIVNPVPEAIKLAQTISSCLIAAGWKWSSIDPAVPSISVGTGKAAIWYRSGLTIALRPGISSTPQTIDSGALVAAQSLVSALTKAGQAPTMELIPEAKELSYVRVGDVVLIVGSML